MKITFGNKLKSSFLLWADHNLLSKGEAFTNHSSKFYDVNDEYNGYFTYASPFKGFVSDQSISGATIMSGVYIDGVFTTKGNNDYIDVNYNEGQVYFSADQGSATVSGDYAIKEYNVKLTDKREETLLFETKFELAPQTASNIASTGLQPNIETYPAIYILSRNLRNEELALGGYEETMYGLRMMVFSDTLFSNDAVNSIFLDRVRTCITILDEADFPFNAWGGTISDYNYTGLIATKNPSDLAFIDDVRVSPVNNTRIQTNNTEIYASIIDIDISKHRYARNE